MSEMTCEKYLASVWERVEKATPVVAWYPHPEDGTVRGPYNRWFRVIQPHEEHVVHGGKWDGLKVRASMEDDVQYAALAMSELPRLVAMVECAREALWHYQSAHYDHKGEPCHADRCADEALQALDKIAAEGM